MVAVCSGYQRLTDPSSCTLRIEGLCSEERLIREFQIVLMQIQ
jgi:hypothetical protein